MTPHVLRDAGGLISININGVYFHSAVLLPFGASVKSILGWNQTDDLSEVTPPLQSWEVDNWLIDTSIG